MADAIIQENVSSLERQKFKKDGDGNVQVRTTATGTFSVTGLTTGGLMTEVALNSSTWTLIPTTALTDRNSISIQNQDSSINIKYNYAQPAGYEGKIITPGATANIDITDSIVVYGKSASGTPTVLVEEIA